MAEPSIPRTYVVRQGEYLEQIAHKIGFDAETVWGHEKNEDLRKLRKNHQILCPGDILYISAAAEPPPLPITAGQENGYQAQIPERTVELKLHDADGPIAGEAYTVEGLGDPIQGKSDDEGKVSFSIPITTREVRLVLENYGGFHLGVGDLDPISEITGVQARLAALGFYWGRPTGEMDDDTRDGIMRLQRAKGLEMSGALNEETLAALEAGYGW